MILKFDMCGENAACSVSKNIENRRFSEKIKKLKKNEKNS